MGYTKSPISLYHPRTSVQTAMGAMAAILSLQRGTVEIAIAIGIAIGSRRLLSIPVPIALSGENAIMRNAVGAAAVLLPGAYPPFPDFRQRAVAGGAEDRTRSQRSGTRSRARGHERDRAATKKESVYGYVNENGERGGQPEGPSHGQELALRRAVLFSLFRHTGTCGTVLSDKSFEVASLCGSNRRFKR